MEKLREFGLADYFLWPQINWNPKSDSIKEIATRLSLGWTPSRSSTTSPSSVRKSHLRHPKVLCIDAADLAGIPDLKRMHPRFITDESRARRKMYQSDERRQEAEREFTGTNEEFLAKLEHGLHHLER